MMTRAIDEDDNNKNSNSNKDKIDWLVDDNDDIWLDEAIKNYKISLAPINFYFLIM